MSIQKKSLISTLKTAKKANVAAAHESEVKGDKMVSAMKIAHGRSVANTKLVHGKNVSSAKMAHGKSVSSAKKIVNAKYASAKQVSAKQALS
ncbi:MAG TPA: hypothetical protein VMT51_10940 [Dongiaceae bacterium]|nr:hypothetical protein [Dongiaceae bacterium]